MHKAPVARLVLAVAGLIAGLPAQALYKVVAPDGTVTYTERPPAASLGRVVPLGQVGGEAPAAVLPAALREPSARFPVTLFTTNDCAPCDEGRSLLRQRGIPFRERIAATDQERAEWARVVGSREAPVLKVGGQTLSGLQSARWQEYLDAAGYPRRSALPASYQAPPAEPLVARGAPAEMTPAAVESPVREAAEPPAQTGGFRF